MSGSSSSGSGGGGGTATAAAAAAREREKENILELADRYNISRVGLQRSDLDELTSPSEVSASEEEQSSSIAHHKFVRPRDPPVAESPDPELSSSDLSLPASVLEDSDDSIVLGSNTRQVSPSKRQATKDSHRDQISQLKHQNQMLQAEMRRRGW